MRVGLRLEAVARRRRVVAERLALELETAGRAERRGWRRGLRVQREGRAATGPVALAQRRLAIAVALSVARVLGVVEEVLVAAIATGEAGVVMGAGERLAVVERGKVATACRMGAKLSRY